MQTSPQEQEKAILLNNLSTSVVFKWNYECTKPVVVNQGGTSSGKTYSVLQVLFIRAINEPGSVITVVGQDIPNLKVGALRDADNIVKSTPSLACKIKSYNKSDRVYRFYNESVIEFNSYDGEQDAKSGKRDYLFVNEANGVSQLVYNQLALRTKKQIFIDYNPTEEFWVHESLINEPDTQLFISNFTDNPFLHESIVRKILKLKDEDRELWRVYGLGKTGKIEGLIFRNYDIVEGIPYGANLIANGMDFGFTNDPTTFLQVYEQNGELWIDELIYETELTNPDIAQRLREYSIGMSEEIVADSAEPKSIQEIRNEGYNCVAAEKGPDSIRQGINTLKKYKLNITKRSFGIRKEIKSYKWKKTKDGKSLNVPVDFMNHSIDALRYVALNKLGHNSGSTDGPSVW